LAAYRYLIQGRVQGVGYRYFVVRQADAAGLLGHVRNLPDGRVEVVAEGPEQALTGLEARLREGPFGADVSGLDRCAVAPTGDIGFHIR